MVDPEFSILEEFPAVDYSQWLKMVESSLQGKAFEEQLITRSLDGIDIRPLYTQKDLESGTNVRTSAGDELACIRRPIETASPNWDLRQEYYEPEPHELNRIMLADIEGGVSSLAIALDQVSRSGRDPDYKQANGFVGMGGLLAYSAEDLYLALDGVDLKAVGVTLQAGASFLPSAAMLIAVCQMKNCRPNELCLGFGGDPLGTLAGEGRLPISLKKALGQLVVLAKWTAEHSPKSTSVCVDTLPYHEAGSSAVQELAIALATAVQYLRTLTGAGMTLESALSQIEFRFGLGTQHFTEIAKLRAARILWSRVVEFFGDAPGTTPMMIHAGLAKRAMTVRDSKGNIVRNTAAVFAASIGGADAITSVPFDSCSRRSSDTGRRIARNTAAVLQLEAHLHRVNDPTRGSWFLETITNDLARAAWKEFQEIEGQGGIKECLQAGYFVDRIDSVYEERVEAISSCKQAIVGVSLFADPEEGQPHSEPRDIGALRESATIRILKCRKEKWDSKSPVQEADVMRSMIESAANGATIGQLSNALNFHQVEVTVRQIQPRRVAEAPEALSEPRSHAQ